MDQTSRELLRTVLSLPTMSFHEVAVATFVRFYAMGLGLNVREDRAGNLLVKYPPLCPPEAGPPLADKGRDGRGRPCGVTFAAHMDHPGFEVLASRKGAATVALWGKVNPKTFAGSKIVVYTANGAFKGKISRRIHPKRHLGRFCFDLVSDARVSTGDFGHYDLPTVRFANGRIVTRAADNLVSVAAILDFMTRLVDSRADVNVAGLFTRGEEAGFLGAFAAMEAGLIPVRDPLIVLECSSATGGGVKIGGGPVIRAGDLQSTYDPAVEVWISDVASRLAVSHPASRACPACPPVVWRERSRRVPHPGFRYQRALLQGGRCEACVYIAEGYRTGGIALPLGNYHNQGPSGPAAEYVSAADYDGLLALIMALAKSPMPRDALSARVSPIREHYRQLKRKFLAGR